MRRACVVIGSAFLLSGCSVFFLNRPPPGDGPLPTDSCTTSRAAPILDAVGAAAYTTLVFLPDEDRENLGFRKTGILNRLVAASSALGMASFAVTGFKSTSECRRRQLMSEQAIADHLRTFPRERVLLPKRTQCVMIRHGCGLRLEPGEEPATR